MSLSVGMIRNQYMEKKKRKWQPNHQPVKIFQVRTMVFPTFNKQAPWPSKQVEASGIAFLEGVDGDMNWENDGNKSQSHKNRESWGDLLPKRSSKHRQYLSGISLVAGLGNQPRLLTTLESSYMDKYHCTFLINLNAFQA